LFKINKFMENPYCFTLAKLFEVTGAHSFGDLAFSLGMPENSVRNWHKRGVVPLSRVRQAAINYGKPFEWFMENHNEKNLTEEVNKLAKSASPAHLVNKLAKSASPAHLPGSNYVSDDAKPWAQDYGEANAQPYGIPVFDLGVSAGVGAGMQPGLQAADASVELFFTPAYMRRHFGRAGNGFAMVYVKGDSMQPTLFDGDEIVVDTRVQRVDRDGIYVFMLRGDIKVKRIQAKLDGSLLVKSDNASYETEQVASGQADGFQVQGRLVWPRLR
jgi:Peptidase S24-like